MTSEQGQSGECVFGWFKLPLWLGLALAALGCSPGMDAQNLAGTLPQVGAVAARPTQPADLGEAITSTALPAESFTLPRVVVSEVMVDPMLLDDSVAEFVELVNLSPGPVRLSDLSLTLPSGRVLVPERAAAPVLLAGAVVVLTPQGRGENEARLRGLRLPNQAGRIELRWRKQLIDVVHWYRKKPWPKAKPGVALERVSPTADGRLGGSWRASRTPLRVMERASPGTVAWSCEQVRGTPLEGRCVASQPGPKTPNRARGCPVRKGVAGGGLEPST